jgi:hypothetical protein
MSWFAVGQLDLKTAQQAISSNWIEAYKLYVSPNSPAAAESPLNGDQVWVNTKKVGSIGSWANTCSEEEALQKGYRPRIEQEDDHGCKS